jgi:hypothetical protein
MTKRTNKNAHAMVASSDERLRRERLLNEGDSEALDLGASEIACAVADAWAAQRPREFGHSHPGLTSALIEALDRLEAVTRASALRKVRP